MTECNINYINLFEIAIINRVEVVELVLLLDITFTVTDIIFGLVAVLPFESVTNNVLLRG